MGSTLKPWRIVAVVVTLLTVAAWPAVFQGEPVAAVAEAERDLAVVDPAEVGIDAKRLECLDAGMQAMVDEGKLAGIMTILARHARGAIPRGVKLTREELCG